MRLPIDKVFLEKYKTDGIKPGAPAESKKIVDLGKSIFSTAVECASKILEANNRISRLVNVNKSQANASQLLLSTLSNRVDNIASSSTVMIDMHTYANIVASGTTCNIDTAFGQCTLPITSSQNLLFYEVSSNEKYVDDRLSISWAYTAGSNPSEADWKPSFYHKEFLSGEDLLLFDWPGTDPSNTKLWVRILFPFDSLVEMPNVLDLIPFPAFGMTIESIEFNTFGASYETGWTPLDLSYSRGYLESVYSNQFINYAGPVRLHLDEKRYAGFRIKLSTTSAGTWGLSSLQLKKNYYSTSGTLKIVNPFGANIESLILKGKAEPELSELATNLDNQYATITFANNTGKVTPVLTGVVI